MSKTLRLVPVLLLILSAQLAHAQSQGVAAHLTVYDAGVAEVLEERTVELQPGLNQVEWRSLMPKAFARTLRVTADDAEVVRVDVTYDGVEVVLTNRGPVEAEAFVREGVEPHMDNRWTILESSAPAERLAANTFQMRVRVPAGGKTTVTYTVETK